MYEYQHSLFFEARDLTDREKEKIRRHFQKRRDSGGGDCAMIEKFGDNIYRVGFKEKQDQERVLQRKFHAVPLPGGELRLTVSRASLPQNQDQPTTSQSQRCTKPNAKHLEKIFRMDIFLLFYLEENPKAFKVLQKQLSLIGCTLEFNFDEEEVVVTGDSEKGVTKAFGATAEKWELQVDRIFISFTENYVCHHVLEPKQVRQLLQDHSFVTDDIKVYAESGYAVVVGETEAVKEKIAILEKSMPSQKELPVVENRFKLVEDEFIQEMSTHYPEIKVTRGTNTIILQGPDEKVQSGAAKLDELIKKIKEKRVQLHPDLLAFMSIRGITSKYQARFQQSLKSPVTLEIGSDMALSSLSSSALDEAEAAVLQYLSAASVQLQGAAAVPPDLTRVQEILNKAKSLVNCGEVRVEVSFIPASSGTPVIEVQLVGYTGFVNKLKEFLHDYQINQVLTQKVLNLQPPELVDSFDKILKMIGFKQTDVTLKASHFPNPCMLVSGPSRRVHETLQDLKSTLASLTSDTLVLDGPGALRYFQEDGKVGKELVESSCQVLIWEQEAFFRSLTSDLNDINMTVGGRANVQVVFGDITSETTDAVVNTTDFINFHNCCRGGLSIPQLPQTQQQVSLRADRSFLNISAAGQPSAFRFLGLCREDVDEAMEKLKDLYKTQCSTHTFKKEELEGLTEDDILEFQQLVDSKGLYMRKDTFDSVTVNGLKDGVNKGILIVNASLLRKEVRVMEKDKLYTCVMWCILGQSGDWERLPKTANLNLENGATAGGIQDAQGVLWQVDLQNMEATTRVQRTKLKRLENLPDLIFPLYWDSMAASEAMKVVVLQPFSQEYQRVQKGFKRTANNNIMKIERLQNIHLRCAYEGQKRHLSEKNKWSLGAGEKFLYHGTTQDNAVSIMNTGFNRRFAGQNATSIGTGTYFAVNANYSAMHTFSKPAADGSQLMFVARVLTGIYTQGQHGMKVPPARNSQRPYDLYDSVVNRVDDPSMYVVFHDDRAYPDYLITFK